MSGPHSLFNGCDGCFPHIFSAISNFFRQRPRAISQSTENPSPRASSAQPASMRASTLKYGATLGVGAGLAIGVHQAVTHGSAISAAFSHVGPWFTNTLGPALGSLAAIGVYANIGFIAAATITGIKFKNAVKEYHDAKHELDRLELERLEAQGNNSELSHINTQINEQKNKISSARRRQFIWGAAFLATTTGAGIFNGAAIGGATTGLGAAVTGALGGLAGALVGASVIFITVTSYQSKANDKMSALVRGQPNPPAGSNLPAGSNPPVGNYDSHPNNIAQNNDQDPQSPTSHTHSTRGLSPIPEI